jgi:FKBP-type peptidyl-prolyl cis-trans isomerase
MIFGVRGAARWFAAPILLVGLALFAACEKTDSKAGEQSGDAETAQVQGPYSDLESRAAYAIGIRAGKRLKEEKVEYDLDILLQGLRDVLEGGELLLTAEELAQSREQYREARMEIERSEEAERLSRMVRPNQPYPGEAEKNKKEAVEFLEANAKKEGVVVHSSGLQYRVLKSGEGRQPLPTDRVRVHYKGHFLDGSEFDNSYERGKPNEFELRVLIPGWRLALQLMREGDHWELFIPPDLGYGPEGMAGTAPNALLRFEVELIEVIKSE